MEPVSSAQLKQFIQGSGDYYPHRRVGSGSLPTDAAKDVNNGFDTLTDIPGGLPIAQPEGPPYVVKGGSLKLSGHAHERMEERTPFHKSHVELIQHAVNSMGLKPGVYHLPLRDKAGVVVGYAQFKGVKNKKGPVLATVLNNRMAPSGKNLEEMLYKQAMEPESNTTPVVSGKFDTDHIDPRPPQSTAWNRKATRVGAQEPLEYALRKGFQNVTTPLNSEVIEGSMGVSGNIN